MSTPSWLWAVNPEGSSSFDTSNYVVTDSNNVYITGSFSNTITFGSTVLTTNDMNTLFVAKADSNGNWLWAIKATNISIPMSVDGTSVGNCLTLSGGDVIVVGDFTQEITVETITITGSSSLNAFVLSVKQIDGSLNYLRPIISDGVVVANGVVYDSSTNNVYVTGQYSGTLTIGTFSIIGQTEGDGRGLYVARLQNNNSGEFWIRDAVPVPADEKVSSVGNKITLSSNEDIYVVGNFQRTYTFGSITVTSASMINQSNVLLAKIDDDGFWVWVSVGESPDRSVGNDITYNLSNNILYITGGFVNTMTLDSLTLTNSGISTAFVAAANPVDGSWAFANNVDGESEGTGIATDSQFEIYNVGFGLGQLTFGSTTIIPANNGVFSGYVTKLPENLASFDWTVAPLSLNQNRPKSIACDNSISPPLLYVTGDFNKIPILGDPSKSIIFGNHVLSGYGNEDIFLAKLGPETPGIELHLSINEDSKVATFFVNPLLIDCTNFPADDTHANPSFSLTTDGLPLFTFTLNEASPVIYNMVGDISNTNLPNPYIFNCSVIEDCSGSDQFNSIPDEVPVTHLILNFFDINPPPSAPPSGGGPNVEFWQFITATLTTLTGSPIASGQLFNNVCGPYIDFEFVNPILYGTFRNVITSEGFILSFNTTENNLEFGASKSATVCCILPGAIIKTVNGNKLIENLKRGDIVYNHLGQKVPVVYNAKININNRSIKYITIPRNSLGTNTPNKDISISYNHPILHNNSEVVVQDLLNISSVKSVETNVQTMYVPITSKRDFVMINNIPVCTFEHRDFIKYITELKSNGHPLDHTLQ